MKSLHLIPALFLMLLSFLLTACGEPIAPPKFNGQNQSSSNESYTPETPDQNTITKKQETFIEGIYNNLLLRPSKISEKFFWLKEARKSNPNQCSALILSAVTSTEFKNQIVPVLTTNNFIISLYRAALKREPDVNGYNYWINEIDSKPSFEEKVDVVRSFLNRQEFKDVCLSLQIQE